MQPTIIDNQEFEGIDLVLDFENGMAITVFLTDEAAQDMINIIQNKLNGRF